MFLTTSTFTAMAEASLDDFFKTASVMKDWIEEDGTDTGLTNSAFTKRFGLTFYGFHRAKQQKALRFSEAVRGWSSSKCSPQPWWLHGSHMP